MSDRWEERKKRYERVDRLVDRDMLKADAYYAAQVNIFRTWLIQCEIAMEDESIDEKIIERVLNRMTLGTPSGIDAYERQERQKADLTRMMIEPLPKVIIGIKQ